MRALIFAFTNEKGISIAGALLHIDAYLIIEPIAR